MRSVQCLQYLLLIVFVWRNVIVGVVTSKVECPYVDTVNVSSGTRLSNDSILYDGLVFPPELVMTYTYKLVILNESKPVESYLRGCICHLKPCVNLCCPWGSKYSLPNRTCLPTPANITWPDPLLFNISSSTMDYQVLHQNVLLEDFFHLQYIRPCAEMYIYDPIINYYDEWTLLDNGEIHLVVPDKRLTREEYCFAPHERNSVKGIYVINPAVCDITPELTAVKHINSITFVISICFILPTIFVYLWLPELRNCLGLSLVCYLSGLTIGYGVLIYHDFFRPDVNSLSCKILGYFAYYGFMSAFFWLNIISFDVFRGVNQNRLVIENKPQQRRRYIHYSVYAWGMALVMLFITWYLQEYASISDQIKPGIGGGHYCWLDLRGWAGMIYFYGPLIVLTAINICLFSMVALQIFKVRKEMDKFTTNQESSTNLQKEQRDNFYVFLRLFLIMGVTWTLEIASYLVGTEQTWTKVFYLLDLCNASLGLLIFLLFVMKKQVRESIKKRLCGNMRKQSTNTLSTICGAPSSGKNSVSTRSSNTTLDSSL